VELAQAYVSTVFDAPVAGGAQTTLQAGRFTMNLGARRLVAADDYRNTTSSVTGLRVDSKTKAGWSATAFYTLPVTRLPESAASLLDNDIKADRESSAAVLYGGLVQTPRRIAGGALEAMLLQFRERDAPGRPTRDRDLTTLDLRLFREPAAGHWDWEAEVALQTGSAHTSTAATAPLKDVAADFVHLRAGYQWASAWKPRLAVEYDRASGEGSGAKSHRFDTLFGMRRADFAPSGLYALVGRANISSPGLRFEATPSARLDVMATARALFLASAVDAFSTIGIKDPKGLAGDHAGTQFDTRLRYWLAKGRFLLDAPGTRKDGDVKFLNVALQANF
jgi:hypothetical protein